jgi:hypothetical protein
MQTGAEIKFLGHVRIHRKAEVRSKKLLSSHEALLGAVSMTIRSVYIKYRYVYSTLATSAAMITIMVNSAIKRT